MNLGNPSDLYYRHVSRCHIFSFIEIRAQARPLSLLPIDSTSSALIVFDSIAVFVFLSVNSVEIN